MSSKSTQHHDPKSGFTLKTMMVAIVIGIVFLTIIIIYPRIFSPSQVGRNSGASPVTAP